MIFAARQLQKKCMEKRVALYTAFVDLTKAFDTMSIEVLLQIMTKFGFPDIFFPHCEPGSWWHDGEWR